MSDQLERLTSAFADLYTVERELGAGGTATVYLAQDVKHVRKVAVKENGGQWWVLKWQIRRSPLFQQQPFGRTADSLADPDRLIPTLDFNEESNMNTPSSLFYSRYSRRLGSLSAAGATLLLLACASGEVNNSGLPTFEVDPHWPKPLPNKWIIGQVSGVAVDSRDHVWIVHRPGSLTPNEVGSAQEPPISACCDPAPPVIEFDQEGNVVRAWGGPDTHDPWPNAEHGIFVDHQDNVWIASSGAFADVVLKFDRDGERLLQIGEFGETGGSENTTLLGGATDIAVDPATNEAYISDGYGNRRMIVYDAESGEYKRHWGAYGETPDDSELEPYDPDAEPLRTYRSPVHSVRISNDGLVYVSDRVGNRFQVFRKTGEYVTEKFIATQTLSMGSVWDIDFSPDPDQTYMYVADGTNNNVWILTRDDFEIVGEFGRNGRYAGQFHWLHSIAVDSHGNIYTGEVDTGMRVQKFVRH